MSHHAFLATDKDGKQHVILGVDKVEIVPGKPGEPAQPAVEAREADPGEPAHDGRPGRPPVEAREAQEAKKAVPGEPDRVVVHTAGGESFELVMSAAALISKLNNGR